MTIQREFHGVPVRPFGQLNSIARHMGISEDALDKFRGRCQKRVAMMTAMVLRPPTGDHVTDQDRDAVVDAFVTAVFNGPSLIDSE